MCIFTVEVAFFSLDSSVCDCLCVCMCVCLRTKHGVNACACVVSPYDFRIRVFVCINKWCGCCVREWVRMAYRFELSSLYITSSSRIPNVSLLLLLLQHTFQFDTFACKPTLPFFRQAIFHTNHANSPTKLKLDHDEIKSLQNDKNAFFSFGIPLTWVKIKTKVALFHIHTWKQH